MSQTLLRRIQDAATDKTTDLPSLLRLCLMLASRLRNDTLKAWVNAELNGYKSGEPLPDYRKIEAPSKLIVVSPFQGVAEIPITKDDIIQAMPEEMSQDLLRNLWTAHIRQSVAEIRALATGSEDGNMALPWPQILAEQIAQFLSNWPPAGAQFIISRQMLTGILDKIVTRVLQMSLDLEDTDPTLGEGNSSEIPKPTEKRIQQIISNTFNITGDNPIVSAPITQAQTRVIAGDLESLRVALQQLGLTPEEVEQTALAVQEEKNPKGVLAKLKKAGGTLALKAAETGVAEVIKGFFA